MPGERGAFVRRPVMPSLARTYSEALGVLTDPQLQAALDRFGLGTLVRAEPAQTGLFGRNVFLSSTAGEYVLRGAPWDPRHYGKEQFFSRLVHERTDVPAPWPYVIDLSTEIFGWAYAVMPRLPGLDVGNPDVRTELSAAVRLGLAHAMGDALARLHALTWTCYGDYEPSTGTIAAIDTSFAEWTVARVRDSLDRSRAASAATTDADVSWAEEVIAAARDALQHEPDAPTFAYRDYKENNAVAEPTEDGWRISASSISARATSGTARPTSRARWPTTSGRTSRSRAPSSTATARNGRYAPVSSGAFLSICCSTG